MVVDSLYYGKGSDVSSSFDFSDEALRRALLNIYSKDFHPASDIETTLFNEVWATMDKAVGKAFGNVPPSDPDADFIEALRRNNAVFSAFKVHRAQNDMARLLLDSNGNLKPFEQWLNEVMPIATHQCRTWLRTEYDTAVIRAHQAADWRQFTREKDVLPNLKWCPSTSITPGEDHRVFWGVVRPIDDDFWSHHRPGDRWNCKCTLSSTDEPVTPVPAGTAPSSTPQKGLENNPGKDAKLFSDTHPYKTEAHAGAKKAVDMLLKRLEEMMREMPEYFTDEERTAIARDNLEIEKALGITKGKPMTVEDADKQSANPNYVPEYILDPNGAYEDKAGNRFSKNPNYKAEEHKRFSINCQTCAPAYVLRLRGFNVTAKGKTPNTKMEYLSRQHSFEAWKNPDGTPCRPVLTADWMEAKGYKQMSTKRYEEYFRETCKEPGVYILTIGWKNGGGHATVLQKFSDGSLHYIEPQTYDDKLGTRRPIEELCKSGATRPLATRGILRVDNKLFNSDFIDIFEK
ncbi:toxin glutamine deamidase domain-containing protein [uncultured Duncaniella sp.]|uniref:toxin glutamine deamidase domain-containing protein n=1 Tax=uncultured Duncaniella sp. TaxID=2768039 RepID=UPI00272A9C72|nr:toxin glutamine deamidase domain-containing protein [uncultured Duncaniella sp.]